MKFKHLLLASAFGTLAMPAAAQETPAEGVPAAAPEGEIVVTGSRIVRDTYDTAAPTVTVNAQDLLESGDNELSETLAEMPALSSTLNDATVTGNT